MNTPVWYHCADGDKILQIMREGKMRPHHGEVFYSSSGFAGCFAMGADRKRKACFVMKLRCHIPDGIEIQSRSTNVPGTKVVLTTAPIQVEVLELYVRPAKASSVETIKGSSAIRQYLSAHAH